MNSSGSSLNTLLPTFLAECASLIVDRIGVERVRAVFVCGSVATEEETLVRETTPPLMLSDVDLAVIVDSLRTHGEWYPRRGELGAACERLAGGVTFVGHVDVGILLGTDLAKLPPRPGVYDMRAAGRMLRGSRAALAEIPAYAARAVDGAEAVALIENRIASLLGAYPREGDRAAEGTYGVLYAVARVYTDIAVAALCVAGRYESGYERRRRSLRVLVEGEGNPVVAGMVSPEILMKVDRWTRFKLEPTIGALGVAPETPVLRRVWTESAKDILWFWRQVGTYLRDENADLLHPLPVDALGGARRALRRWRENTRSWNAFLPRYPLGKRIALAASLGAGMLASTPLETVRSRGVRLLAQRLAFGGEAGVQGGPCGFPHAGGRWEDAAAELASIWHEIVAGRRGA